LKILEVPALVLEISAKAVKALRKAVKSIDFLVEVTYWTARSKQRFLFSKV
jgi:hypothetical protein